MVLQESGVLSCDAAHRKACIYGTFPDPAMRGMCGMQRVADARSSTWRHDSSLATCTSELPLLRRSYAVLDTECATGFLGMPDH